MLNLRLVKGPLKEQQNETILLEYNRLTGSQVSSENFRRWIQDSPEGPAYHALLETDEGQVVGHCCLFPFPMRCGPAKVTAAKAEYYFIHENYRTDRIRGFEESYKPPAVILIEHLYRDCRAKGWGPYLVSAPKPVDSLHKMAGCRSVTFPLVECLVVLRPVRASLATPNLSPKQSVLLFFIGMVQRLVWSLALPFLPRPEGHRSVPVAKVAKSFHEFSRLFLPEDRVFLEWRYPEPPYFCQQFTEEPRDYVIVKGGSETHYLRVCQSHLGSAELPFFSLLLSLIRKAHVQRALGVRWAVYNKSQVEARLISLMRKLGFLCVRRERAHLIHSENKTHLTPDAWEMSDSFVSFDH